MPFADGLTDFAVLQNELKGRSTKIVLIAFDLLYLNGYGLRKLPVLACKADLKHIIHGTPVQFSESFEIDGQEMYQHACKLGLEVFEGARQRLQLWPRQQLGQEDLPAARDARHRRLCPRWLKMRGHLSRPPQRQGSVYAGKLDHGFDNSSGPRAAQASGPADP